MTFVGPFRRELVDMNTDMRGRVITDLTLIAPPAGALACVAAVRETDTPLGGITRLRPVVSSGTFATRGDTTGRHPAEADTSKLCALSDEFPAGVGVGSSLDFVAITSSISVAADDGRRYEIETTVGRQQDKRSYLREYGLNAGFKGRRRPW